VCAWPERALRQKLKQGMMLLILSGRKGTSVFLRRIFANGEAELPDNPR
jgi:hypothetical protein